MSGEVIFFDNATLAEEMRAIDAKLAALEKKDATTAGRKALRKGALLLRKAAKELAPVGKSYTRVVGGWTNRTRYQHEGGLLRKRGIVMSRGRFGTKHVLSMLVKTATRAKMGIPRAEKGYYPAIVEYGVKKGPRRFEGKAYLGRAMRSTGQKAMTVAIESAFADIEKVLTKRK